MGHDITAYLPGQSEEERDKHYEDHNERVRAGMDWLESYHVCKQETQAAYLRRSAGNPLNQVIYLALGVSDEAYCGCSGCGVTLPISRQQLVAAKETLAKKSFSGMTREPNLVDLVFGAFAAAGATTVANGSAPGEPAGPEADITPEVEFIDKCLAACEQHGVEAIDVRFA